MKGGGSGMFRSMAWTLVIVLILLASQALFSLFIWVSIPLTQELQVAASCNCATQRRVSQNFEGIALQEIVDLWPHVLRLPGRVLVSARPAVPAYPHAIKRMCVIGERHSGTEWLEEELGAEFQGGEPHRSGMAFENCHRHKHWFHYPGMLEPLVEDGDLIFVVVRNAVDWLLNMAQEPHHAYSHADLPFEEFLTRPWVPDKRTDVCTPDQERYLSTPYYETYSPAFGGPYPAGPVKDVMQLRAMKLDNFLRLQQWVPNAQDRVIFVRYEDMIDREGQGLQDLINEVKSRFEIDGLCRPEKVVDRRKKEAPRQRTAGVDLAQVHDKQNVAGTKFESAQAIRTFFKGTDLELEKKLGYNYDYLLRPST
ncbi:hypothetical protein KFL_001190050 [Klebsormidium nitens]|uniref:Sulfotransferase n=1 Tax=Klebsormidium nitens TaxID=105231 RepID=A0A0U9HJL5_KLENI|nr:hypothetical protein KFL_001190050 [Klebsormidium nitens]|eukprot:GAQ82662.1 hypothetical protein KFL_001190050 [Klebsormidium nitens]